MDDKFISPSSGGWKIQSQGSKDLVSGEGLLPNSYIDTFSL
jgi:hypothetical protein